MGVRGGVNVGGAGVGGARSQEEQDKEEEEARRSDVKLVIRGVAGDAVIDVFLLVVLI